VDIRQEELDGVCVFAPVGRIDSNTARDAEAALLPKFDDGHGIVVDLAELTYISSAGLRVLLMAAKRSKASGVPLALAGMAPSVLEVFEVSGFAKLFKIFDNRTAAVASIAAG
jgi:anti-sigma B factor antagonist